MGEFGIMSKCVMMEFGWSRGTEFGWSCVYDGNMHGNSCSGLMPAQGNR